MCSKYVSKLCFEMMVLNFGTAQMYMLGYPQTIPETMERRRQHMNKTKVVPTNIRHTTTGWLNRVRQAAEKMDFCRRRLRKGN